MSSTVKAALARAAAVIGGDESGRDAELLLQHVLERPRAWIYAHGDALLDDAILQRLHGAAARRAVGEPLAYITGRREFWSLDLHVTPQVLVPRPETELLVELALQRIAPDVRLRIADLGTGSGALALAIAHERPRAQVLATDCSDEALAVARANAQRLRIGNVEFARGDWCDALGALRFAAIVSNPPYLASFDPHLLDGDLRFEPRAALASGADGLAAIRVIARTAPAHLETAGWLLLEHGFAQGAAVREILSQAGFVDIFSALDLEQRERVSGGIVR